MSDPQAGRHGEGPRHLRAAPRFDETDDDLSFDRVLAGFLRHRRAVVAGAMLLATLAVVPGLLHSRTYTAKASFMPQSRRASSNISGLAAQFGLSLPTADAGQSPAFYVDLLKSRGILRTTVHTSYSYATDTGRVEATLLTIYRVKDKTPGLQEASAMRSLEKGVDATAIVKTGVVELSVRAPHPVLAKLVCQRLLELINRFNLETRQSEAAAERKFTEQRLVEIQADLLEAEKRLQQFLQQNREYRNSPELTFRQDRLAREVSRIQQLYNTLADAHEQAKIEEVRDTPVLTMVDEPTVPVRPDSRGLLRLGAIALVVGGALGFLFSRSREPASSGSTTPFDAELAALKREALEDLRHPLRFMRRRSRAMA